MSWDEPLDRRGTSATKWDKYAGSNILPFWVADMDLPTPDFVLDAIRARLDHPVLGYTNVPEALVQAFLGWLARQYQWQVDPQWLLWLPGVVPGMNLTAQALVRAGDPVFVMPPVYYPFLAVPAQARGVRVDVPLREPHWDMDLEALRSHAQATRSQDASRLLLLCNPQNPTGRVYRRDELVALGELCIEQDLLICSDEIHCELLLDPATRHWPIASLEPAFADRTISLFAPTKTYNMPGLGCAVAVVPDAGLRARIRNARRGMLASPSVLAYAAATAAYQSDGTWLAALRAHLRGNRDLLASRLGSRMTAVAATYLAWLDVRDLGADGHAGYFEQHGLGLSEGRDFGSPGFVRFNFACGRALLHEGIERLHRALTSAGH